MAGKYPGDPVGYANHVLGVTLTPDQETILRHLLIPPCWVNVPSANNTGKTFLAAVAISWWFDSFRPSAVYSVAKTHKHVTDVLWGQLRILRYGAGLGGFIGPRAPEMWDGPDHTAQGITAVHGESFRGRHIGRKLFVLEESTGLAPLYFDEIRTMADPATGDAVLMIYNPTDTTSRMYQEDMRGQLEDADGEDKVFWRFPLSALRHPNILAELRGERPTIPGAVNASILKKNLRDWCEKLSPHDTPLATDVEWPPSEVTGQPGEWYRPGPEFQAKVLGQWPDTGSGVWSDALWDACFKQPPPYPLTKLPVIGCDTARGRGEDFHAVHVRWGARSVHHETANTMDPLRIFNRLKECAHSAATLVNRHRQASARPATPQEIPINIDDDGVGDTLEKFLRAAGYTRVKLIGAGTAATRPDRYHRMRDELWFAAAEKARSGGVYLGDLDRRTLQRLRQQLMAPTWDIDATGARQVEEKDDTKEKIGRSPDDADAFNLSHHEPADASYHAVDPLEGKARADSASPHARPDGDAGQGWWGQRSGQGGDWFNRR